MLAPPPPPPPPPPPALCPPPYFGLFCFFLFPLLLLPSALFPFLLLSLLLRSLLLLPLRSSSFRASRAPGAMACGGGVARVFAANGFAPAWLAEDPAGLWFRRAASIDASRSSLLLSHWTLVSKSSVYRRYKIIFASLSLSLAVSLRATKPSQPPSIFPSRVFHTVNSICFIVFTDTNTSTIASVITITAVMVTIRKVFKIFFMYLDVQYRFIKKYLVLVNFCRLQTLY